MTLQRMHRAMSGGIPTAYNDPALWTLIQSWDTAAGEMAVQEAAFTHAWAHGLAWSDDGLVMTAMSSGNRAIRSFSCSIPFDPDSTVAQISAYAQGFEGIGGTCMHINEAGTQVLWHGGFNNFLYVRAAANWAVASAGLNQSDMSRTDWGFVGGGAEMASQYPKNDFSYVISDGGIPSNAIRRADLTPDGNLDAFALTPLVGCPQTTNKVIIGTKVSKDGKRIYRANGGVELLEMSTPDDPATMSIISNTVVFPGLVPFQIDGVYINPNDTRFVWLFGSTGAETEIALLATNI